MDTSRDAVILFSKECLKSRHWMSIISDHLRLYFLTSSSLYRVTGLDVERLIHPDCPSGIRKNAGSSFVQIVILSQAFLSHLLANPAEPLDRILGDRSVIVLLVDIYEEKDIKEVLLQVMPGFSNWARVKTNDEDTVLTKIAVSEHVQRLLEKLQRNQESRAKFELHPSTIHRDRTQVAALLQEPQNPMPEDIQVEICCKDFKVKANKTQWINPCAISFKVPAQCFNSAGPVMVQVKVNQESLGIQQLKCVTDIERIGQLLNEDPVSVVTDLCKVLGLDPENYDELDYFLAEGLRPSVPMEMFSWFSAVGLKPDETRRPDVIGNNQFPTLLHFGSRFGLERFVSVLMDCPGAVQATQMKDSFNMDCIKIAHYYGHKSLGHFLEVYTMFFRMQTELQETIEEHNLNTACMKGEDQEIVRSKCSNEMLKKQTPEMRDLVHGASGTSKRKKSSYLGELRDFLEGFKEGNFTLEQVEMLVQWWKDRPDVQRENIAREEQLKAMRKEHQERAPKTGTTTVLPTSLSSRLKLLFGLKSPKPTVETAAPSATPNRAALDRSPTFYLPGAELSAPSSPYRSRHSADSSIPEAKALYDEGLPESCTTSNASLLDEEESPYMVMQAPRSADSSLQRSIWFEASEESLTSAKDEGDYVTIQEVNADRQQLKSTEPMSQDQFCFPHPPT